MRTQNPASEEEAIVVGNPLDEPFIVHPETMRQLLQIENPIQSIAVFMLLMYHNKIRTPGNFTFDIMKELNLTKEEVHAALRRIGPIEIYY